MEIKLNNNIKTAFNREDRLFLVSKTKIKIYSILDISIVFNQFSSNREVFNKDDFSTPSIIYTLYDMEDENIKLFKKDEEELKLEFLSSYEKAKEKLIENIKGWEEPYK